MQIEILETFLDGRERYEQGETRTVTDENGIYFCGNGWAKDKAGQVETGERNVYAKHLDVRGASHDHKANEV